MKKIFLILALFQLFTCLSQNENKKLINCIFKQTKKIEIYAFLELTKWEGEKRYMIYNKGKVVAISFPEKYLRNKIILNKKQIKKLKNSLVSTDDYIDERADCYFPRHTIVFYNKEDKILGYIELCFGCFNSYATKNLTFLEDSMLFQQNLFEEFGITYLTDTKEEEENYSKLAEKRSLELKSKFNNKNE
ncbi:hypothetical protein GOQ30_03435 [Flavobacterium sp. TP390]|uniref:Uncharacterized protein n=1 Tax=Flavobacterium profundi TaxID=1774945 RepID=A0A6I4IRP2_9FLAO|nr:hypothetical protein [Flavobacterium profundi]MVO08216.1 hypothetical protein [Flavobacterium profundi]